MNRFLVRCAGQLGRLTKVVPFHLGEFRKVRSMGFFAIPFYQAVVGIAQCMSLGSVRGME